MAVLNELSSVVKQRRTEMGLTQAALADLAGLSRATVNDLEQGKLENLGVTRAEQLLNVLGMSLGVAQAFGSSRKRDKTALDSAARIASVSYRKPMTGEVLREALVSGTSPSGYRPQLRAFLDEAPVAILSGVAHQMEEEGHGPARSTWQKMRALASTLQCTRGIWG